MFLVLLYALTQLGNIVYVHENWYGFFANKFAAALGLVLVICASCQSPFRNSHKFIVAIYVRTSNRKDCLLNQAKGLSI